MKTILERGKRMKKKGFTLIELLAVIVILAIIALIAVPVVMNIISKANKSAFKDSAYGLLKAGESYYTSELLEDAEGITEDVTFTFPNNIEGLEFQGSKPTGGTMTVRKDGKISLAIHNGKHCVTKGFEDEDIQISDDISNCGLSSGGNTSKTLSALATTYSFKKVDEESISTAVAEEVTVPSCITNKTKCNAGTPVAVEVAPNTVYKFYVLNDDTTKNEVTLIMDRNLYSAEDLTNRTHAVAWINAEDYGNSAVKSDKGPLTALKVLKERTSGWTNIPAYTYTLTNDADGLGGTNTYSPISKSATATEGTPESVVENVRARLPRREEIYAVNNSENLRQTPWLYENLNDTGDDNTAAYWTSTVVSTESHIAWHVYHTGYLYEFLGSVNGGSTYGLRPVITLSK